MNPSFRITVTVNITDPSYASRTLATSYHSSDTSSFAAENSTTNGPYFSLAYGNVRGSFPSYRVGNTIGVAVIIGISLVAIIIIALISFLGFVCYRKIKNRKIG
jgi:hypothetical protein